MKTWRSVSALVVLVVCLCAGGARPQALQAIRPASGVDENLFLLRALAETYNRWPRAETDRQQLAAWIAWSRQRLVRVRAAIRVNGLDPDIGRLYDEGVQLLDRYQVFLEALGAIEKQTHDQAGTDALASIWKGYQSGTEAEDSARRKGASKDAAGDAGALSGIVAGVGEAVTRSQQRSAAEQAAIAEEQRKIAGVLSATDASAVAVADKLARKYGWPRAEAGFDGFQSASLNEHVKRRPRDPFALAWMATTRVKNETAADVMRDANACVRAAELVPEGRAYDMYRVDFIADATELALTAVTKEIASYTAGPSASTPRALEIAQTYLAIDPDDPSGRAHVQLARALALSHRYDEAVTAANAAVDKWRDDVSFRYRYARLMSLTNRLDVAEQWLVGAFNAGWSNIGYVRTDPDLAAFRNARAQRFAELTTPRLESRVEFGLIWDDAVIVNRSAFDLTNVHAKVFIRKGQQTWNPEVVCDRVRPGESCRKVSFGSIPGDAYDEMRLSFTSDQDPK